MMRRLLIISWCLVLGIAAVQGATYYVSATGDDGNPGTEASPWRTHAAVEANAGSGDVVLYRRGDVFTGSLTVPDGLAEIGAYGSAVEPPTFDGENTTATLIAVSSGDTGLSIHDIRLIRWTSKAIDISGATSVDLEYLDIGHADLSGTSFAVYASGSAEVTLEHASIYRCDYGVRAVDASVTVSSSLIAGCRNQGIYHTGTGSATYDHSIVVGCGDTAGNMADRNLSGVTDGGGNVAPEHVLSLRGGMPCSPRISVAVDDVYDSYETWVTDAISQAEARGYTLDLGVICYDIDSIGSKLATWAARGHGIYSHGWGSQRATYHEGMRLQYTGSAACTLDIARGRLTTSGCDGDVLDYDLTDESASTYRIGKLCQDIDAKANYTCSLNTYTAYSAPANTLADVSGQDIQSAAYDAAQSQFRLVRWDYRRCYDKLSEIDADPEPAFVWPAGLHDSSADDYARYWGFLGARNAGGTGQSPVSYDVMAVDSCTITELNGATAQEKRRRAASYATCRAILCEPGIWYLHPFSGISADELGNIITAAQEAGAGDWSLAGIVSWVRARGYGDGIAEIEVPTWWRPLWAADGDGVDAGAGDRPTDIRGLPVVGTPDIGAYEYRPMRAY